MLQATRRRPQPVGLVGFDDFELAETLGISVVAHDPQDMGEVAARMALSRMDEPSGVAEQVVLPTTVVLRGSQEALG